MSRKLYEAVIAELFDIDCYLFLTPYFAKRKAMLEELKSHMIEGDASLAEISPHQ